MSNTLLKKMASRIRSGKVVPIISSVVINDLILGGHASLIEKYSEHTDYPLKNSDNLPHMAQFKSVTDENIVEAWDLEADYIKFIKTQLYNLAKLDGVPDNILAEIKEEFDDLSFEKFSKRLDYPKFSDEKNDPLLILANFPLPVYLTTSYHSFIEIALRKAGKTPRTEICRWHKGLESIPSVFDSEDYEPSKKNPLVYHLCGFDEHPESLVLTEDDYLEFLIAISEYRSQKGDRIAARIRQALTDSALIMLGYSLSDWDFRTLFLGLILQRSRQPQSVCVQLKPGSEGELYLKSYLRKAKFEVYWGTTAAYLQELYQEVEGQL